MQQCLSSSFAARSRNKLHFFVAHFTVALVSQATSLANFTTYTIYKENENEKFRYLFWGN